MTSPPQLTHNSEGVFEWLYSPCGPWTLFQSPDLFTIGRTPWTSDKLVARSLPQHRRTQTQNKHIYTLNIHALSGIRIHHHSVRASEDSSCLRLLGNRDRQISEDLLHINTLRSHFHPFMSQKRTYTLIDWIRSAILHLKHSVLSLSADDLRSGGYNPFTVKLHLIEPVCMQTDHFVSI
jgi:hypothetical protein